MKIVTITLILCIVAFSSGCVSFPVGRNDKGEKVWFSLDDDDDGMYTEESYEDIRSDNQSANSRHSLFSY